MRTDDFFIGILSIAIVAVIAGVIAFFAINSIINGTYGGFATEHTYDICSGENKEVFRIFNNPVNACEIKDCDKKYDGITYCEKRVFLVCGNDFCKRPWED